MEKKLIISGDSHVLEPNDLFFKPLGKKYGDEIPRYIDEHLGVKASHYFTGIEYIRIDEIVEGNEGSEESQELQQKLIRASEDPAARLRCLDEDGVYAEVLNSTWMLYTMRARNNNMVRDCCRVYNDWMAELVSHDPKRLVGTSMIHMEDVDWAVKELERTTKMGLKGTLINCDYRPEWLRYQDKHYDPFWACAQELNVPVVLHIITGNIRDPFTLFGDERLDLPKIGLWILFEAPPVLANEFIFGGVMDRFPTLKVMLAEYEVSWLPYFMFRIRQTQDVFGPAMQMAPIKQPVDEYMKRVYHSFVDDTYVEKAVDVVDPSTMLWGSDFPHARCTYPNSLQVVEDTLGKLGDKLKDDLSFYNAAKLFDIEAPESRAIVAE
jgi:predicted TIM-barrel fold metal-dependent hydrolase